LSVFSHLVKSDFVRVVKDDKVVEFLMSSKAGSLSGNTLLEASITSKSKDVVVKDLVVSGVVTGSSHLFRDSETNSVGNTSSKRTGGALNSWGGVLRVGEFRVTRCLGVVLTEVLKLINGEVESGKVQPRIKEHRSVSGRKDETITVDPSGVLRVVLHLRSVKGSSNFGASKGKTHVSRVGSSNGVHSKTTGFVGSSGKGSHLVSGSGLSLEAGDLAGGERPGGGSREALNTGSKSSGGNSKHGEFHLDIVSEIKRYSIGLGG
jgi:hypothetical protein